MVIPIKYIDCFSKYQCGYITFNQLINFIKNNQNPFPLFESPRKEILEIAENPGIYFDKTVNKYFNKGIYFDKQLIDNYLEPHKHGEVKNNVEFWQSFYLDTKEITIYGIIDRFVNNTFYKDIFYDPLLNFYDFVYLFNSYEWRLYLLLLDPPFRFRSSVCYNIYKLKYRNSYSHTFKRYQLYPYRKLLSDVFNMTRKFLKFIYDNNLTIETIKGV